METICEYYNTKDELNIVLYDYSREYTYIINTNEEKIKIFKDIKNMRIDMLTYIANDFNFFEYVKVSEFAVYEEEVPYLKEQPYGKIMIDDYIRDWGLTFTKG